MPDSIDSLHSFDGDSAMILWGEDSIHPMASDSGLVERSGFNQTKVIPSQEVATQQDPTSLGMEGVRVLQGTTDWIFWIFVGAFIIVSISRFTFPRRFLQVVSSMLSERSLVNMLREGDLFTERIMLALMSVYISMLGLLLLIYGNDIDVFPEFLRFSPLTWFLLTAIVLIWWLLRSLLVLGLGFVFRTFEATSLYLSRMLAMNLGIGLLILLILPVAWYSDQEWIVSATLWLVLLLNIYRTIRGIGDALRLTPYSLFYLLLFALATEILPLLVLAGYIRYNLL